MKHLFVSAMLLVILWLAGCQKPERPLTSRQLNKVDSLFYEEVKRLQPVIDSLCLQWHDSVYRVAFDSIWLVRLSQNADLIHYGN